MKHPYIRAMTLFPTLLFLVAAGPCSAQEAKTRWQERDEWQNVPGIFQAMGVEKGSHVADLGAGKGYLTLRLAKAVGSKGRVYAVDIDEESLEDLRENVEDADLDNVSIVRGEVDDPRLAASSLDAIVIVNAYHEMDEYSAVLAHLRRALRPQGRLVLVDSIHSSHRESSREIQTASHELGLEFARQDLEEAGFEVQHAKDPFVSEPWGDDQWLLVAVPARPYEPRSAPR